MISNKSERVKRKISHSFTHVWLHQQYIQLYHELMLRGLVVFVPLFPIYNVTSAPEEALQGNQATELSVPPHRPLSLEGYV